MPARVVGLGQWFPERIRENSEWPANFRQSSRRSGADRTLIDILGDNDDVTKEIGAKYLMADEGDPFLGTRRRRVADPNMLPSEAETLAARAALDDAGIEPTSVDAVLSWALVPDRLMLSNACRVVHALGASRAWAATLDAACASPVAQLQVAAGLIESGRAQTVLITLSHLTTRVLPMEHPASPNLGDGAAAMVVTRSETPGIRTIHMVTHGELYDTAVWCRSRVPEEDPAWWESGGAFTMASHDPPSARRIMQTTIGIGMKTVRELLERARVDVKEISCLASVQPRGWVPTGIAEALGLPQAAAPSTFTEYAHLGGAGPVVNLIAARERGLLRSGSRTVMYAQGAGFIRAAALVDF